MFADIFMPYLGKYANDSFKKFNKIVISLKNGQIQGFSLKLSKNPFLKTNIRPRKIFFKSNNLYTKIFVVATIFLKSRFFLKSQFLKSRFICSGIGVSWCQLM